MQEREKRPSPEALLKQARKEGRGRLKIFLGAAPGVGKTYAMLRAAHRRKDGGADVCVGLVESHGRAETEAMIQGLEVLPRASIEYRGRRFPELDVDAILKRRPQLVLVDEFAHSNIPGTRFLKRYQDIEELLAAGIDVYSTLNVQHLESLNDVVTRITGVEVRETVPDKALETADEIELIDLPPEDLIQRLKEGKVYVPEQARHALNQFFGRGTLTALRELAMRAAAERVDAAMLEYKQTHAVTASWPTRERLLVCVNETDISQQVIRAARRIAGNRRIPWIALHVETPRARALPDEDKDSIARNLRFAERLGAEVITVPGSDLVQEVLACAHSHNVSQIIVGRPQQRRLRRPWLRTVAGELIRRASPLEVTIVTWVTEELTPSRFSPRLKFSAPVFGNYLIATLVALAATAVSWSLDVLFSATNSIPMVYLLAVLLVAVRRGLWPSLYASILGFVLCNYFFMEPRYSLVIASPNDLASLIAFMLASLLAGNLGARLMEQVEALKISTRQANEMAEFGARLAVTGSAREVVAATVGHLCTSICQEALVMLPHSDGTLLIQDGSDYARPLEAIDNAAAKWAYENDKPAGWNTDTLPAAGWLFIPLTTARSRIGVVGLHFTEGRSVLDGDERRQAESIGDLAAVSIERIQLALDLERSRVLTETESLRAALLSSVSHDLRTPLVSVIGAADSLVHDTGGLSGENRHELAETILQESERLNRFVQNLLDMTRLSYGGLQPRMDWCDLRDIIVAARKRLARVLSGRNIQVEIDPQLPLLRLDPVLIEQVFVNLLDNAAKYSPANLPVRIQAERRNWEILIQVIDEGSGIAAEDREKVFDMFYRARAGDTRTAGTGLGLSICRGFVMAMGGSIAAGSGPNNIGTVIEIRFPYQPPPASDANE